MYRYFSENTTEGTQHLDYAKGSIIGIFCCFYIDRRRNQLSLTFKEGFQNEDVFEETFDNGARYSYGV